jgi:hypothetical protein
VVNYSSGRNDADRVAADINANGGKTIAVGAASLNEFEESSYSFG